jgi:prophage regulatory protein
MTLALETSLANIGLEVAEVKFLRIKEVIARTGKSRASIYGDIKKGRFPAPVKLGGSSSGWVKSEIDLWSQGCIDSRRTRPGT